MKTGISIHPSRHCFLLRSLLLIAVCLLLPALYSLIRCQTEAIRPEKIVFHSSVGDVTLRHVEHTRDRGVRCIACHHRYVKAEPAACSLCHPKTQASASDKFSRITRTDALHKRCINCHSVTTSFRRVKPPVDCSGCHIQRSGNSKK
jgi:hypothetical protein